MKLTLPLPPNLLNARMHWRTRHAKTEAYYQQCTLWAVAGKCPRAPLQMPEKAEVRATVYLWSLMDEDGLTGRLKWPIDWMVYQGYLTDDKPKNMSLAKPAQYIDRKNPRVELTVTPIPETT
ncbi:MAG: hypothetical protein WB239_03665 [Acidimicrobiia bacterium]